VPGGCFDGLYAASGQVGSRARIAQDAQEEICTGEERIVFAVVGILNVGLSRALSSVAGSQ
jgi:hypothetical protein